MWSPKRLLLLLLGFSLFFGCYQLYSLLLGHYDGLPPLPAEYQYSPTDSGSIPELQRRPNHADEMLMRAFGPNCEELQRRIKLEWRTQGTVLAAETWKLLPNGQLRLTQVSVAMFGKASADGKDVDINSVRGSQADVEFDRPISNIRDAASRKPIAGKLIGNVVVKNNRKTTAPEDDVRLYTTWLAYSDLQHRLWTDADVRLVDSDPALAVVAATGMEVLLIPGDQKPKPTSSMPKPALSAKKPASISGVKEVRLKRNVCMDLLIDSRSSFLGAGRQEPPGKAAEKPTDGAAAHAGETATPDAKLPAKPVEKTPVVVNSQGPFIYYVAPEEGQELDRAEFTDRVSVIRRQVMPIQAGQEEEANPSIRYDQLDCEKLVLKFRRKRNDDKAPTPKADDQSVDLELVNAHATGSHLELVSDGERLHATGTELTFDKEANQTILQGRPVEAEQDGHQIRVHGKLILKNAVGDHKGQEQAHAIGPGEIRMLEQSNKDGDPKAAAAVGKPPVYRFARWQKELITSKEGDLDKLTFSGKASFEDPQHGRLDADQIVVWLAPKLASPKDDKSKATKPDPSASTGERKENSRAPRRMEAVGNVTLNSKELQIPRTDHLRIQFEDRDLVAVVNPVIDAPVAAAPSRPPAHGEGMPEQRGGTPAKTSAPPVAKKPVEREKTPSRPLAGPDTKGAPAGLGGTQPTNAKAREPIVLTARTIDVTVLRTDSKADLKDVRTEGQVHVTQKGARPEDKGVEIRGERLDMTHTLDGNILKVVGQPGYVQMDRLTIIGPTVNIDQVDNKAWVNGVGSMKMPSKSDFEGNPLKEPVDVIVYWNERMFFDGRFAEFDGGVQADQGDYQTNGARLVSKRLEVVLDRFVSLKEKQPGQGDQPASLYRLMCDQDCRLEKGLREGDRWRQYQRVMGREVAFENPTSELSVYGPGVVHMLQLGSKQASPLGSKSVSDAKKPVDLKKPGEQELKLTRIKFEGHMQANKNTNTVVFSIGINLVHLPADRPDVKIDEDNLPPGGFAMTCGRLKATTRKIDEKTSSQEFEATTRVHLRAKTFRATADIVKYDESKDLLILEGIGGNPAILYRQKGGPGSPLEPVKAEKIWYWQKENRATFDRTETIQVNP